MVATTPLLGLAFGMLLTATGLALWNDFRERTAGLAHAAQMIGWVASALLLITALLLWAGSHGQYTVTLHLTLMAAIAAPQTGRRHGIAMLPMLVLTGGSFYLASGATQTDPYPLTLVGLAFTICGGLAMRILGEALGTLVNPRMHSTRLFDALYLLLTLLLGGTALANLWQRGTVWAGATGEGGLAGAWLGWSAAWLSPRQRPRFRAGLTAVAALLLILTTLRFS